MHLAPDRVDVLRYRRLAAQTRKRHCPDDKRLELQALILFRDLSDRYLEADTLHHADADQVHTKLAALDPWQPARSAG